MQRNCRLQVPGSDVSSRQRILNLQWGGRVQPLIARRRWRYWRSSAAWAVCHGDDQIASVLNRLGYSTGESERWNQIRVATARRNYSIPGQRRALPDPDRVSLNEAARICGVSHRTIERLVEAGLLKREQVTPRALWMIRRADLNNESVRITIDRLLRIHNQAVLVGFRAVYLREIMLCW